MKKLFALGDQYARESDWKDIALIKFCLCAMGIVIGTKVAPKYKEQVTIVSAVVFFAAYIPLMAKLFKIILRDGAERTTSTGC